MGIAFVQFSGWSVRVIAFEGKNSSSAKQQERLVTTNRTPIINLLGSRRTISMCASSPRRSATADGERESRLVAIFAPVKAAGNELAGVVFALRSAALARSLFLKDEGALFGTTEAVPLLRGREQGAGPSIQIAQKARAKTTADPSTRSLVPCLTNAARSRC